MRHYCAIPFGALLTGFYFFHGSSQRRQKIKYRQQQAASSAIAPQGDKQISPNGLAGGAQNGGATFLLYTFPATQIHTIKIVAE